MQMVDGQGVYLSEAVFHYRREGLIGIRFPELTDTLVESPGLVLDSGSGALNVLIPEPMLRPNRHGYVGRSDVARNTLTILRTSKARSLRR